MKTLIIGDLHLKAQIILPLIEPIIDTENIQHIIFLGDYVDDWRCNYRSDLYIEDLMYLLDWKAKYQNTCELTFLIGNHDAAYLLNKPTHYSLPKHEMYRIASLLHQLDLQLATKLDNYLVSHAGLLQKPDAIYFQKYSESPNEYKILLAKLYNQIGRYRGGTSKYPSCLWCDEQELIQDLKQTDDTTKQIIGHTPTVHTNIPNVLNRTIINMDTFSMHYNHQQLQFYGNGEVLMYDDQTKILTMLATNYAQNETMQRLINIRR